MSEPTHCARCGAPIDPTDSVHLQEGASCLACVEAAARAEAHELAYGHYVSRSVGWAATAVAAMATSRWLEGSANVVALAVGMLCLGLALWSMRRASQAKLSK